MDGVGMWMHYRDPGTTQHLPVKMQIRVPSHDFAASGLSYEDEKEQPRKGTWPISDHQTQKTHGSGRMKQMPTNSKRQSKKQE